MRVDYEIGRPLKLKQYPTLASLFQTHKSKQYDGWYSYNDLFWKDPLPGTLERARSKTGPHSIAQIHVSRFFCISEALGYSQSSVVESALSFGATAPFREQRVAIAGDYDITHQRFPPLFWQVLLTDPSSSHLRTGSKYPTC